MVVSFWTFLFGLSISKARLQTAAISKTSRTYLKKGSVFRTGFSTAKLLRLHGVHDQFFQLRNADLGA